MKNKTNIILILFIFLTLALAIPYAIKYDNAARLIKAKLKEEEIGINQEAKKEPEFLWYDSSKIIIIGDSRMYLADKTIKDDDIIFIAKNGATCNYLTDVAEKEVDKLIANNPEEHYTIFLNLGINDLDFKEQGQEVDGKKICSASDYANLYKRLNDKWKEHNLVFESVNPLDLKTLKEGRFGNKPMSNNEEVKNFNQFIQNEVSKYNIFYCDTYTYLLDHGFESYDGLHYSDATSKVIIEQLKDYYYKQQDKLNNI